MFWRFEDWLVCPSVYSAVLPQSSKAAWTLFHAAVRSTATRGEHRPPQRQTLGTFTFLLHRSQLFPKVSADQQYLENFVHLKTKFCYRLSSECCDSTTFIYIWNPQQWLSCFAFNNGIGDRGYIFALNNTSPNSFFGLKIKNHLKL